MTTLVIGGNRGIGYALVQELYSKDSARTIFATTRNPSDSEELNDFASKSDGKIIVVQLDMLDEASVKSAVAEVSKNAESLDHLYINSGIMLGSGPIYSVSSEDLLENMRGNVVGPHNIFKAFSPLVAASKSEKRTISVTSSLLGSIGAMPMVGGQMKQSLGLDDMPTSCYGTSKTAVNALIRSWGEHLEPKGIAVIAVHPGLVATRMSESIPGGISPAESAKGFVNVVNNIDITKTKDGIYSYDGTVYPW